MAKKVTPRPQRKSAVKAQARKPAVARQRAKKKKGKHTFRLRLWWDETPRWVIWAVAGLVAVVYMFFMYRYYFKPYFYRWDFGNTYAGNPVVHGIDVSHHQGVINWAELAKAENQGSGIHFVYMKATEGADWLDSTFVRNFREARAIGLLRGAYHFFSPLSSADKQADFFISQVSLQTGDLPPVLDVEKRGSYGEDSLRQEVKHWLRRIEAHYGVKPVLYTSRKFKERYLNDSLLNTYPFWIAHYYVDSLTYRGAWSFWQHTDRGQLPGVDEYVDMNVFNGDLDSLKRFTVGNQLLN